MGKSCDQLTDHCRHVIVVVKWLLFSHSSSSHVYSSENKWGLVLCLWVEYNSSFFMGKEAGSCRLLVLCLILHFHLRTTLSWGGNTGNQMLVGSRSISWRIRAWKMSSLDECRSTRFFLLGHTKPVPISLSVLFFYLRGTVQLFFHNSQVYKTSHGNNSLFQKQK